MVFISGFLAAGGNVVRHCPGVADGKFEPQVLDKMTGICAARRGCTGSSSLGDAGSRCPWSGSEPCQGPLRKARSSA